MINALIIDDEKNCRDTLHWQLKKYCPQVALIGEAGNAEQGHAMILEKKPQLVFLDVEMPGKNGLEMLESMKSIGFHIIFTTAFAQYALRAIKFGALDYLIKPVDKDELIAGIRKLEKQAQFPSLQQIEILLNHARKETPPALQKIALPTLHGYELAQIAEIVVCESESNYTKIRFSNGKQLTISRTLKEVEELLGTYPFCRVHHSYLVNLSYAVKYIKGEGGSLILSGNITVPVARSRKEELLKLITAISL